ncbi:hypothetical protein C84B14_03696 [Salinisphaera sp. C84B14]
MLNEKLKERFHDVKIIFYYREPVAWAKSLWSQRVKGPTKATETYDEFVDALAQEDHIIAADASLECWSAVFGRENIYASAIDQGTRQRGSITRDFFARLGLSSATIEKCAVETGRSNMSPSYSALKLVRIANVLEKNAHLPAGISKKVKQVALSRRLASYGADFPAHRDEEISNRYRINHRNLATKFMN